MGLVISKGGNTIFEGMKDSAWLYAIPYGFALLIFGLMAAAPFQGSKAQTMDSDVVWVYRLTESLDRRVTALEKQVAVLQKRKDVLEKEMEEVMRGDHRR